MLIKIIFIFNKVILQNGAMPCGSQIETFQKQIKMF